LVSSSYIGR